MTPERPSDDVLAAWVVRAYSALVDEGVSAAWYRGEAEAVDTSVITWAEAVTSSSESKAARLDVHNAMCVI